ncbi:MAG: AMP-binding protein, partial [Bacteroidales bacterium]
MKLTFQSIFNETVTKHGDCSAFAFAGERPKTYNEVAKEIRALTALLEKLGIVPGDRVAILALNSPNWGPAFFAVTFMGAVAVPILPDFSPTEVANVLSHSGARAIFISGGLLPKLEGQQSEDLKSIVIIEDYTISGRNGDHLTFNPEAEPLRGYEVEEEDLASIIYTSGTTGRSKGVMLTHRNISSNALKGHTIQHITEKDRFLSVLPLSHTYENTLGLLLPVSAGSCVYYLRKPPTPSVLLPALEEVKPTLMLSVPLIMEKIYFNKIRPQFTDNLLLRKLYQIPLIRRKLNALAGKK